jgi:branched-chain amino acid aminotransferase
MAFAVPFGWILKPEDIEMGLDAAVTKIKRISPNSIDPTIKNYHWLDFVNGMFEAYDRGHQTGILVDEKNNILEGPGFNIFSLNKNILITPKKGVLQGITRGAVIDIAKELHIPVKFGSISKEKLMSSSEFFATSTAGGIMPITKINGQLIGQGKPGEITRKLHKAYWKKHSDPSWSESIEDLLK